MFQNRTKTLSLKRDVSELYHRIEKYWLKELQLKKPSFARAVWKAENSTMVVIIARVANFFTEFIFFLV